MICPMVPFPVTLGDPQRRFQGHRDAIDELCAQLTSDLFAIAKFLIILVKYNYQELSYRKQIARQLRAQFVDGISL